MIDYDTNQSSPDIEIMANIVNFAFGSVVIGAIVSIFPVGASEDLAISGAIPPVDGPTSGRIISAFINASGFAFAKIELIAPGKPNDGRVILVDADKVTTERRGGLVRSVSV